jgi:hypothetical protein
MTPSQNLIGTVSLLAMLLTACVRPTVVPQDGKKYAVAHRDEALFVYVEYQWKGGRFDDATVLENEFVTWARKQGIFICAMGRYPTSKLWQLGFTAERKPDAAEFKGRKISTLTLPEGDWVVMQATGHTDRLFFYWKKLARWAGADGHTVEKPVFEVYPDILKTKFSDKNSRGRIEYPLSSP